MELGQLFKITEERFQEFVDRVGLLQTRMEDLLFRAQRVSNAIRNNQKMRDGLFADDLQTARRAIRSFLQDASAIPGLLDWLDRETSYSPLLLIRARSLLSLATRFQKETSNLTETARMLHNSIIKPEDKIDAWYVTQELETGAQKFQGFPFLISSRIVSKLSTPAGGAP